MFGDASKNWSGLVNFPTVPVGNCGSPSS